MEKVMCISCGHFVIAEHADDKRRPKRDTCPRCEGTEFKDTESGTYIQTDE